MATAFVFPGQGSQVVGMGKALADGIPAARAVFEEVDEALGEALSRIIWEGPEAELTRTRNAQPALMAVSLAAIRALQAEGIAVASHADCVAGHSLGEYSALAAAGALPVAETARLLRIRGEAMQRAVPEGVGAMAVLLGLDREPVEAIAAEAAGAEVCEVANDNAAGQVVIAGHKGAVERAIEIGKSRGAKRAMLLAVSAPFHCALMRPAAEAMAEALAGASIRAPAVPVIANVRAEPVTDPDEIRRLLVEQVTETVRWRDTMAWFAQNGIDRFIEIGAGRVLSGLAKRGVPGAAVFNVGLPEEVHALAAEHGR